MGEQRTQCESQPKKEWGSWRGPSLAKFGMNRDRGGLDELDSSSGKRRQESCRGNHLNKSTQAGEHGPSRSHGAGAQGACGR